MAGTYLYHYPTFIDTPQLLTIHYLTPDQQKAFVSYPNHPNFKAPQFVPVEWFNSVIMQPIKKKVAKKRQSEREWQIVAN